MKQKTKKRTPPNPATAPKEPRKKSGPKPSKTSAAPAPAGHGATRLRDSINTMVADESLAIARALVDKTKAGNMTGASLIVKLSGDPTAAPPEIRQKRGPQPWIKRVSTEPELPGPWDEQRKRDASRLPLSDFDLSDDLK